MNLNDRSVAWLQRLARGPKAPPYNGWDDRALRVLCAAGLAVERRTPGGGAPYAQFHITVTGRAELLRIESHLEANRAAARSRRAAVAGDVLALRRAAVRLTACGHLDDAARLRQIADSIWAAASP